MNQGDKVLLTWNHVDAEGRIHTIAKRTSTQVTLDNGDRYTLRGRPIGGGISRIRLATDKDEQEVARYKLVCEMQRINWHSVSLETLEEIKETLDYMEQG